MGLDYRKALTEEYDRDRESARARCASPVDLHGWYADELQPKVARAVAQGRIDPARACELHRLLTSTLHPPGGPEASR
jgi:hypothetical protein